jgi:hypothetical protein
MASLSRGRIRRKLEWGAGLCLECPQWSQQGDSRAQPAPTKTPTVSKAYGRHDDFPRTFLHNLKDYLMKEVDLYPLSKAA